MHKELLRSDEFDAVANALADEFGTADDDKLEKNDKLDAFLEEVGSVNFYVCTILLILDPKQEFTSFRSNAKMFLLPVFQIGVPFGMCWYFLVEEALIENNGYCCNHSNFIFRLTGFVTFMYSGWQIIDGCDDASSKLFLQKAVEQWALTGRGSNFTAMWMFYLAHMSQQLCSLLLLIVTYLIYTSQCDTPLDLLMNCVAVNFVLDIDSEWMGDNLLKKAKQGSIFLYKEWRDVCAENATEVKNSLRNLRAIRSSAPRVVKNVCKAGDCAIIVAAYVLVFAWTFCPPSW